MGKNVGGWTRRRFLKAACVGAGGAVGSVAFPYVITPAKAQPVTITYLTFLNPREKGPRQEGVAAALKDFEAKYPNIKVDVRIIPWPQIDRQFILEAAAGKEADVARLNFEWLHKHVEANSILPLDEFVRDWTPEQRKDWIFPWEATVFEGKKVAFPLEHRVQVLYYRRDMLEKAGRKLPTTWTELGEISKALTSDSLAGFVIGLSKKDNASNLTQWLIPAMWSLGGNLWDKAGRAAFNTDAGVRTFQFLADLVSKYGMPKSAINMGSEDLTLGMKASTIAMTAMGSHRVGTARMGKGVGENLQTAPLPCPDGTKPAAYVTSWVLGIGRNTKHKAEAWKFLEHRISADSQVQYARIGGEMPSRASAFKDPYFRSPEGAEMKTWADYIARASRPYVLPAKFIELGEILGVAVSRVIIDGVPVKKALQEAEAEYNRIAA
jgi:ABC-type glycerol-3-phosphate transport system substrate-binding protein